MANLGEPVLRIDNQQTSLSAATFPSPTINARSRVEREADRPSPTTTSFRFRSGLLELSIERECVRVCGNQLRSKGGLWWCSRRRCSPISAFPRILILQMHDIPPSSPPSLQSSPPSPRPRRRLPLSSLPTLPLTTQSCTCLQSLSQYSVL